MREELRISVEQMPSFWKEQNAKSVQLIENDVEFKEWGSDWCKKIGVYVG